MDNKFNRREFIKKAAITCSILGGAGWLGSISGVFKRSFWKTDLKIMQGRPLKNPVKMPFDLVVVKGDTEKAVSLAFELLGGIQRFVPSNAQVVLKINMTFPNLPAMATSTNPIIVQKVAKLCLEAGAKRVMVLDHVLREPEICLARTGIREACKGLDAVYVMAINNEKFYQETLVNNGMVLGKVKSAKDVINCDILINLPIAKSHSTTGVTMGMKNMMGLIWNREYFHKVVDINKAIPDLWTVFRPDLTLLDASRVLIDGGPAGPGKVRALNTIVAGRDPVAVDSYGVTLAHWYDKSFQPQNIKHIVNAHKKGLGQMNLKQLRIKQDVV